MGPTNTSQTANAQNRVNYWERKLLDLTKSNALINIRYGNTCIALANEATEEIYAELTDGCNMPLLSSGNTSTHGLQTALEDKILAQNAKELMRTAQSNLEEIGNAQLFVAMGMLQYMDTPNPFQPSAAIESHVAPVLLLPIKITRQRITGVYYITATGEEPCVNITLIELLKQQHERDLSLLVANTDTTPDYRKVMETFQKLAASKTDWHFSLGMCVGIFSFAKFVMWSDIHTNSERMLKSSLVESLVEKRKADSMAIPDNDARTMDKETKPIELALPLDADSSQIEAVADAAAGKSFLLYGPPGTGKSQTITNIIANAIYHKQQVLFVAQKRAALEVVQERLQQIGIDSFCLELHSNKATKTYLINQLEQVINSACSNDCERDFHDVSEQLFARRKQLLQYIEALNAPHTMHGDVYSLADCIELYCAIDTAALLSFDFDQPTLSRTTNAELDSIADTLHEMQTIRPTFASVEKHPLRTLLPRDGRISAIEDICVKLQELRQDIVEISLNQNGLRKWFRLSGLQQRYHLHEIELQDLATTVWDISASYEDKQKDISQWIVHRAEMKEWSHYSVRWNRVADLGYPQLANAMNAETDTAVVQSLRRAVYQQRAMDIIDSDSTLAMFNGKVFEEIIAEYRRLFSEFQSLTKQILLLRLQHNVRDTLLSPNPVIQSSLTIIRRWIKQHGRGMSIRHLFAEHGEVLRTLCPCLLMSPISVAQYLPIYSSLFDMVLFDEASQIPTSEAVGAIARGKAVVIVGDPKQMPPTTFFQTQLSSEEDIINGDMESVLDDCITLGLSDHYLNYHYRSRHESLIAFSNHYYYDDKLVTFPSADNRISHLHYCYVEGVYDYSATRTNRLEAEALVGEVLRRLSNPEQSRCSMGIIAFSKVQQNLIEELLSEQLLRRHDLEKRAFGESREPLFVKNLENVQGDERDVIFLSVGYGPDKDGKISMNFGPLNNAGGERRLNVAVTRARQEMLVFTGMHSEDIDLSKSQALGVEGLKNFLYYAEHHELPQDIAAPTQNYPLHPIAIQLADVLRNEGYRVDTGVGQSDFRIDVAVVNPACPDMYLLGIQIDGRRYYQTPTMRDRALVQPNILQGLGWKIVHIWQEDYFCAPQTIIRQLLHILTQTNNNQQ